jgi:ABC-type dipeptide/oligopeptide/nickel transport system permease subunit
MPTARIVRGSVLSIKRKEYVEAAINVGVRENSIMVRHILPNVFGAIIVAATLQVANAILTESTLSFLGPGLSFGHADLGTPPLRRQGLPDRPCRGLPFSLAC